jgi:hypothetical protein
MTEKCDHFSIRAANSSAASIHFTVPLGATNPLANELSTRRSPKL